MNVRVTVNGENPFFARIIIAAGRWKRDFSEAQDVLTKIYECWPKDKQARFLLTSSGFIDFPWAGPDIKITDNWKPGSDTVETLRIAAEERCKLLISDELRKKLSACSDFLSIGIDSEKYNKLQCPDCWPFYNHIEFVAIIDLKNNHYYWTGKSYPQQEQERGLIRNQDISNHFIELPVGKTLIFACNDLMLESPRGENATKNGSKRDEIRKQYMVCLERAKPSIVIHHAHTTNDPGTWRKSFNHLRDTVPSMQKFSSNGVFSAVCGTDAGSRLCNVLANTTNTESLDFVVIPDAVSLDFTKSPPKKIRRLPEKTEWNAPLPLNIH